MERRGSDDIEFRMATIDHSPLRVQFRFPLERQMHVVALLCDFCIR
jgi:hypothetical protein